MNDPGQQHRIILNSYVSEDARSFAISEKLSKCLMTKPDLIPSPPSETHYAGRSVILADKQAWRSLVSKVAKGRSRRLANSRYEAS